MASSWYNVILLLVSLQIMDTITSAMGKPIMYKKISPSKLWFYRSHPPYYGFSSYKHHPYGKLKDVNIYFSYPSVSHSPKYAQHTNLKPHQHFIKSPSYDLVKYGQHLYLKPQFVAQGHHYQPPQLDLPPQHYQPKPIDVVSPHIPNHFVTVGLGGYGRFVGHNDHNNEVDDPDIRPITEHIEGDIKYDFRTKTHSYD